MLPPVIVMFACLLGGSVQAGESPMVLTFATADEAADDGMLPAVGDPPLFEPTSGFENEPANPWTLSFEPSVWYVGTSGNIRLPGQPLPVGDGEEPTFEDDLGADSPRVSPLLEFHLRRDRWRLTLEYASLDIDDRGSSFSTPFQIGNVPVFAGEDLFTDFTLVTGGLSVSYRFEQYVSPASVEGNRFVIGLEALAGVRAFYVDVDFSVNPTSGMRVGGEQLTDGADELFVAPVIGARIDMRILERIEIDVQADFAYFDTGDRETLAFNIIAGFDYKMTDNVALQIGYRLQLARLTDGTGIDQFEWEGGVAGVYAGLRFSF